VLCDRTMRGAQVDDGTGSHTCASTSWRRIGAIEAGVKMEATTCGLFWTTSNGHSAIPRRFGITHVDFATQSRTWKRSANWYQSVIASDGASLENEPSQRARIDGRSVRSRAEGLHQAAHFHKAANRERLAICMPDEPPVVGCTGVDSAPSGGSWRCSLFRLAAESRIVDLVP